MSDHNAGDEQRPSWREGFQQGIEDAERSQRELVAPSGRRGILARVWRRLAGRLLRFQQVPQARFNSGLMRSLRDAEAGLAAAGHGMAEQAARLAAIEARLAGADGRLTHFETHLGASGSEIAGAMQDLRKRIEGIETHLADFSRDLASDFATVRSTLAAQGRNIDEVGGELVATAADMEEVREEWADAHEEQLVLEKRVGVLERRFEPLRAMDHFDFARRYRKPEAIQERLASYARIFGQVERVLDFGCGRGEFLEACGEVGVGAYGVDSDPDMVSHCKLRQVDAHCDDALEHLRGLPNRSLDGFFSAQVVEHLTPAELAELIQLCSQKLKRGAKVVIETINPGSFSALRWYFLDPTHSQPVPPEMLRFFLEESSFEVQDVIFTSPVEEDERLLLLKEGTPLDDPALADVLRVFNENARRLNEVVFGPQDYAIVAER